jgi:hypothetical protein
MALPNDTVTTNIVPVQGIFKPEPTFDLITFIGPAGTPFLPPTSPFLDGVTITNSTINSTVIGGSVPAAGTFTSIATTSGTISNLPVNNTDIANKQYVDSVAQGLDIKAACLYGTTANITLSGLGTQAGGDWPSSLSAGDRVLVKNQTSQADNGIYVASASGWTRASDMSTWAQVPAAFTFVEKGTTLSDSGWVCTSDPGGTIGVTAITWTQFSGAGTYLAGNGLQLTGNTFSVLANGTTINVSSSGIKLSDTYPGQTSITTLGTITTGVWHGSTIDNNYLTNSSITINGTTISLGGTATIKAVNPFALTIGTGLSGTSYDGSAAVTIANTGVLSFSGGTTGLTPNTATTGAVTLGGLLGIANGGTNSTATPTAGGVAYGTGTAYAFTAAGTAGQFLQSTGSGTPTWSTPSSGSFQPAYYGTFVSTANQANGGATTANAVNFDTVALSNGVSITSSNRITFANAGIYLIAFELAVTSSSGTNSSISTWLAQNGTNIANTTSDLTILGGANQPQLLEQQWILNVSAGDYVQIYWASSSTNVSLIYAASATSPTRPASPSAVVNVQFIPPSGQNLVVNSSTITGGTSGYVLFDNAGTVGEIAKSSLAVGTATNLAGGAAGYVPYQSASGTTLFVAAGTTGQVLTSNGSGAPTWSTPTAYATVTDDTTTNATRYPLFANQTTGNLTTEYTASTKYQFNPSTGILTATGFSGSGASLTSLTAGNLSGTIPSSVLGNSTVYIGTTAIALNRASGSQTLTGTSIDGSAGSASTATTATNATNIAITDNTSSSATWYPVLSANSTGNNPATTSSTKMSFVPSTGTLSATSFSGTGTSTYYQVNFTVNTVTVTSNAGTVPITYRLNNFTNSSAATMTITMATASAVDGQMSIVRIYDFSAVAQTISWVNTENSSVTVPTTSNGSTTLPLTVGFMYNSATSKWRCIASA